MTILQHTPATRITGLPAPSPGGLHSAFRAGGSATPTGFAARASAEVAHALTFNPNHSLGVDQATAQPVFEFPEQCGTG